MKRDRVLYLFKLLLVLVFLSSCSVLPTFGPSSNTIEDYNVVDTEFNEVIPYKLIDITSKTIPNHIAEYTAFSKSLKDITLQDEFTLISVGDLLSIQIWENDENGLFATNSNKATIFNLYVENNGAISLPYIGDIDVKNKSLFDLRKELIAKYKGKMVSYEIQIQIKETQNNFISVLGAVKNEGRVKILSSGMKLLDVLALCGGVSFPKWEVDICVVRNDRKEKISYVDLLNDLTNNIVVLSSDIIYVERHERKFPVYGAVVKGGNVTVNKESVSLTDILGEVRGLNDLKAEANDIFIFRQFNKGEQAKVYRVNFDRADAFYLAQNFRIKNDDIIYVGEANSSSFRKFMSILFSPILGGVGGVNNIND